MTPGVTRPIPKPEQTLTLPPRLCAGVADYVEAWSCGHSAQKWDVPFDKRDKGTHRFDIADTRGRLSLTVPIVKPETSRCTWDTVRISTHGAWWDVHRVALESAYGRTPYFEFFIDRFLPMLTTGVEDRFPLLKDLALAWDAQIRDILSLPASPEAAELPLSSLTGYVLPTYRQIRAPQLGFISGLSILDLIFNLGPESQLYLNSASRKSI